MFIQAEPRRCGVRGVHTFLNAGALDKGAAENMPRKIWLRSAEGSVQAPCVRNSLAVAATVVLYRILHFPMGVTIGEQNGRRTAPGSTTVTDAN